LRQVAVTIAYRTETGVRDWLSRRAAGRGWSSAVIPYAGYAGAEQARVLGRVVLAPAAVDPAAVRGIAGWRRLLTLESPGTAVVVELDGTTTTVTSDAAGLIDASIPLDRPLGAGTTTALLHATGRRPVPATVHVAGDTPGRGVVCDIDDTVWVTGLAHPLRAAWRTLSGSSATRRSVPGMANLLQAAVAGQADPAVVYLSNGPWNFAGPITRFLDRHGFPPGAVLMTDWGVTPHRWFRDGREHKSSSLARLVEDLPHFTWVLVGDDGEHDPDLYGDLAKARPDRVAAIALRQVRPAAKTGDEQEAGSVDGVPVLRGADGDALLPLLRDALRNRPPAGRNS
jgi:phosphatidate phosphatase APP1